MANFVEINVLRPYGINNVNRDGNNNVKTGTVGGDTRTYQTSQNRKHFIRNAFSEHFGKTYHTRYVTEVLIEKARERGLVNDSNEEEWVNAFEALAIAGESGDKSEEESENGKDRKTKSDKAEPKRSAQVTVYSDAELDSIVDFVQNEGVENISEESREGLDKMIRLASVGAEIALFGRMVTSGIGSDVESATHFNFAYSIDDNYGDYDYFTAVDNYHTGSGSAHINTFSFASNTMYGYANIDPEQAYRNLAAELEYMDISEEERRKRERELKKLARDASVEMIREYLTIHPSGKQHAMASFPVPSAVYITVVRDGFPCTMDNAFNGIIRKYGRMPVSAIGAQRMVRFITEDAPKQNYSYRAFCADSLTNEFADSVGIKNLPDSINVYRMNELDTVLEEIAKEIDDILA